MNYDGEKTPHPGLVLVVVVLLFLLLASDYYYYFCYLLLLLLPTYLHAICQLQIIL